MSIKTFNFVLKNATVGASETALPVTVPERVTHSSRAVVDLKASGFTVGAGITFKLQDSFDGVTWNDISAATSITAAGTYTLRYNPETAVTYLPFRPMVRVVVTTGAGSAVTIDHVYMAIYD